MSEIVRYSVILDPLGMANVVSDREPGPGPALWGLTGEWRQNRRWMATYADAAEYVRWHNAGHKPARPAERAGE